MAAEALWEASLWPMGFGGSQVAERARLPQSLGVGLWGRPALWATDVRRPEGGQPSGRRVCVGLWEASPLGDGCSGGRIAKGKANVPDRVLSSGDAENPPVGLVGEKVDGSIRTALHVTDSLADFLEQSLFAGYPCAVEGQAPHVPLHQRADQ